MMAWLGVAWAFVRLCASVVTFAVSLGYALGLVEIRWKRR